MQIIARKDAKAQSLKHYFTGQPCTHGHVAARLVSTFGCVICTNDASKAWQRQKRKDDRVWAAQSSRKAQTRAKRPEALARRRQLYAEKNRDKQIAAKVLYAENKKRRQQLAAARAMDRYRTDPAYRLATLERLRRYRSQPGVGRKRVAAHKVRLATAKGREIARAAGRNYRARKREAEGFHTAEDIEGILQTQGFRCNYCPADLREAKRHIDHIKPLAKGGSNWPANLQALCVSCNCRKQAVDAEVFETRISEANHDDRKKLVGHIIRC